MEIRATWKYTKQTHFSKSVCICFDSSLAVGFLPFALDLMRSASSWAWVSFGRFFVCFLTTRRLAMASAFTSSLATLSSSTWWSTALGLYDWPAGQMSSGCYELKIRTRLKPSPRLRLRNEDNPRWRTSGKFWAIPVGLTESLPPLICSSFQTSTQRWNTERLLGRYTLLRGNTWHLQSSLPFNKTAYSWNLWMIFGCVLVAFDNFDIILLLNNKTCGPRKAGYLKCRSLR